MMSNIHQYNPVNIGCSSQGESYNQPPAQNQLQQQSLRLHAQIIATTDTNTTSQQHQSNTAIPIPIISNMSQHKQTTLVKTQSGRHIWWMNNSIPSNRNEIILKRRLKYLQQQQKEKENVNCVGTEVNNDNNGDSLTEDCSPPQFQQGMQSNFSSHAPSHAPSLLDSLPEDEESAAVLLPTAQTTNNEEQLYTSVENTSEYLQPNEISHETSSEIISTNKQSHNNNNIIGHVRSSSSSESSILLFGDDTIHILMDADSCLNTAIPQPRLDVPPTNFPPSLNDEPTITTQYNNNLDQSSIIPMVQLSTSSKSTYLDFGEENIVGNMSCQSFVIQAPSTTSTEPQMEYQIKLNRSIPNTGISCSLYNMSGQSPSGSTSTYTIILQQGRSKMIHVMWSPINNGCIREKISIEVTTLNRVWKQDVVIVGEAQQCGVVHQSNEVQPLERRNNNMVSEMTNDTLDYSADISESWQSDGVGQEVQYDKSEGKRNGHIDLLHAHQTTGEQRRESSLTDSWNDEMENMLEIKQSNAFSYDDSVEVKVDDEGGDVKVQVDDYQCEKEEVDDLQDVTPSLHTQQTEQENCKEVDCTDGVQQEEVPMVSLELSEIEEKDYNDTYEEELNQLDSYGEEEVDESNDVQEMIEEEEDSFEHQNPPKVWTALPLVPNDERSRSFSSSESSEEDLRLDNVTNLLALDNVDISLLEDKKLPPPQDELEVAESSPVATSAEKLQREVEDSLLEEELENEHFLAEEEKARIHVSQEHEEKINDFEVLLAAEGLVDDDVVGESSVEDERETTVFEMDEIFNTASGDENSHSSATQSREECLVEPKSPSFGSLSSEDDSFDYVPTQEATVVQTLAQPLGSHSPRVAISLADCLDEVRDYLVNDDDAEVVPSPAEQLILKYPGIEEVEQEESALTKMMEEATDAAHVDDSPLNESELLNTDKSELSAFNEISELEELTKRQHEYITSPTSDDFHTQLDNLNDGIDSLTPPSVPSKAPSAKGTSRQLPTKTTPPTPKSAARKCFFSYNNPTSLPRKHTSATTTASSNNFKTPYKNSSEHIQSSENEDLKPEANITTHSKKKDIDIPKSSATKKLTVITEDSFKTPSTKRSDQIRSIRDKLKVLSVERDAPVNDTVDEKPRSVEQAAQSRPSSKITPKEKLLDLNELPSMTTSSARKCFFYNQSPACSESRRQPPQSTDVLCSSKKEALNMRYKTPSLGPREMKAYEKHVNSTRKQKNKENSLSIDVRSGSSSPSLSTPSPREAIQKHIKGMEQRLKDSPLQTPSPRGETAYDRHIRRMRGQTSSTDEEVRPKFSFS